MKSKEEHSLLDEIISEIKSIKKMLRKTEHSKQLYKIRLQINGKDRGYTFVLADSKNDINKYYGKRVTNIQLLTPCPYEIFLS